jgi:hypothetical protein
MPKHTPTPPRPVRAAQLISMLAALAAGLLLVACGGSGSPSSSVASEQEGETKLADFARCLREHGVEAEIGTPPGGGRALKLGGKGAPAQGKMEAAQKACAKYRPQPKKLNLSPQEKVQREEAVLKFAKCMREHGIEVHASAAGGAIQIQIHGHPGSGPNPESPAFQSAQSKCQGYLPSKFGSGPPGGAKGSRQHEGSQRSGASLSIAGG